MRPPAGLRQWTERALDWTFQTSPANNRRMRAIPTYDLYGEARPVASADTPEFLLHCEEIYERSRIHGWEIRPHRHRHYFQILYIASGAAELGDGRRHKPLTLPCLVMVPVGVVHGFRFSNDVDGFVLTIAASRLATLIAADVPDILGAPAASVETLTVQDADHEAIVAALKPIPAEYATRAPGYGALVESMLVTALVRAARLSAADRTESTETGADIRRIERLARLVDRHYREHRPVGFYAGELGLSATHLNRILKRARGTTVQRLLAERLVDEAKRSLVFGIQSVKAIALGLGFSDTAYFTRFFQRETGMRPTDYRRTNQDRLTQ